MDGRPHGNKVKCKNISSNAITILNNDSYGILIYQRLQLSWLTQMRVLIL